MTNTMRKIMTQNIACPIIAWRNDLFFQAFAILRRAYLDVR